ncbi:hypothetical protein H4R34_004097 [Dimargaris verticillata]|uniref:Uncharacterized protein n=1 Tax=Dimargaris verticillata TaxID=2761393 RepID=A0A9W8B693_9FUNG|nr:hypothetical protein H4R34_004097 [Dimargaris verticillata]
MTDTTASSLYLRVKRGRDTVFVMAQPHTTVGELKKQVYEALSGSLVPSTLPNADISNSANDGAGPDATDLSNIRLGLSSTGAAAAMHASPMELAQQVQWLDDDEATAMSLRLLDNQLLFAVSRSSAQGSWETIDIPEPDPVDADDETDTNEAGGAD